VEDVLPLPLELLERATLAVIPSVHGESSNEKTRPGRRPSLALTGRSEQRER
jgi:hypothetical protein